MWSHHKHVTKPNTEVATPDMLCPKISLYNNKNNGNNNKCKDDDDDDDTFGELFMKQYDMERQITPH
jgi:hypothetical protein